MNVIYLVFSIFYLHGSFRILLLSLFTEEAQSSISSCPHGKVVLVEGTNEYEGRIAVCVNGQWSSICKDSFWGPPDARVICRQLGFLEVDISSKF